MAANDDIEAFEDVFNEEPDADEADEDETDAEDELEDDEEADADEQLKQEKDIERERLKEEQTKILPIKIKDRDKRMTSDSIDLYELAGQIGLRAKHIENGDRYFVDSEDCDNAIDIARKEVLMKKSPIIIERTVAIHKTYRVVEQWSVNELIAGVV